MRRGRRSFPYRMDPRPRRGAAESFSLWGWRRWGYRFRRGRRGGGGGDRWGGGGGGAGGTVGERSDLLKSAGGDGVSVHRVRGDGVGVLRARGGFVAQA